MNPGKLNQRITFLAKSTAKNAANHSVNEWVEGISTWASLKPINASEHMSGGSELGDVRYQLKFRYRTDVLATMRIKQGNRIFEITAPPLNEHEASRFLICECMELLGPLI